MVFTNLGENEKQAFFDLLDEYFSSRPDLLSRLGQTSTNDESPLSSRAAASAVHNALASNPEATASLISSGLKHGSQNSSVKNSPFASAAADPAVANSIGRVAAASLAFGQRNTPPAPAPRNTPPPPPASRNTPPPPASRSTPPALPRRTSSTFQSQEEDQSAPPPNRTPSSQKVTGSSSLVQGRSFGNVDTTSFSKAFVSVKNSNKSAPSIAPPLPPAFPKRQNSFAPPPIRRVPSDSAPALPARSRTPEPEPEPEPEEEPVEWAEALYEYNSGESGDLVLQEKQRLRIVSRDSDDWWTGELNGKQGLFPASYVRVL